MEEKSIRLWSACFRLGRLYQFQALYLFQKIAAVHDVIKLDGRLAAAETSDELFERVIRIVRMDFQRAQVPATAEASDEFVQRVASFEGQSAGLVGTAHQI